MLGAMNDSLIRNSVVVYYTYFIITNWPTREDLVTLTMFAFVLPSLLLASYAGKSADMYDKVLVYRIVKIFEIIVVFCAMILFYYKLYECELLILFALGIHNTFSAPIKYAILPQYFIKKEIIIASGYIEFGTLLAILTGQMLGGWLIADNLIIVAGIIIALSAIIGCYYSFKMERVAPTATKKSLSINIFYENWCIYKQVISNQYVKVNMHLISWFWCLGTVYTVQFALFTLKYLGANAQVFSFFAVIYTLGLGIGSIICAQIASKYGINRILAVISTFLISFLTILILLQNNIPILHESDFIHFVKHKTHIINFIEIFIISICSGFLSITAYTDLQLNANSEIRSQTIAITNLSSSLYIIIASIIFAILLPKIDIWNVMMLVMIVNIIVGILYLKAIKKLK